MGLTNREYYRDSTYGGGPTWLSSAPITRMLLIVTSLVYLLQIFTASSGLGGRTPSPIQQWGVLIPDAVLHGQVWRLITYAFLHDPLSILHLLGNMLALYCFGQIVESLLGRWEYLTFYLTAAVFAGVLYLVWGVITHMGGPMLGASGATFALMTLFACHYPRQQVLLFFVPIEARYLVALFVVFTMLPILFTLQGNRMHDGIAHAAHAGGLLFGFLYWKFNLRLTRWNSWFQFSDWAERRRLRAAEKRLRVYAPDSQTPDTDADLETGLEAEVDRILEKIHTHGTESLNARERRIMERASERYKRRR